jgi:alpha-L-fucosidase
MNSNEQLSSGGINSIEMLGLKNNLQWSRNGSGLKIDVPKEKPCDYAFAFKITLKGELTSTE